MNYKNQLSIRTTRLYDASTAWLSYIIVGVVVIGVIVLVGVVVTNVVDRFVVTNVVDGVVVTDVVDGIVIKRCCCWRRFL